MAIMQFKVIQDHANFGTNQKPVLNTKNCPLFSIPLGIRANERCKHITNIFKAIH